MKISLYWKFILAYIIFGITAFIAIATLSSKLTDIYLLKSGSSTLYDEANLIASSYSAVYSGKDLKLSEAYPQLKAVSTFLQVQIWVVDKDGKIIVDSENAMTDRVIADFDPTVAGNKSYITGNYFGTFPYKVLSVYAPIVGNYKTYGYVVIHRPMTIVEQNRNEILNIVYITFVIVFLLSTVILVVFQLVVFNPLKAITEATKQYAAGNLHYTLKVVSNDEIGYLAATLNYMSDEISKTEDYQRSFITNISHDFRSPLTSIKGYLGAMLDGTIPPELYKNYISRVLGETERLTKLTNGILTLNSMDAKNRLTRTNFHIDEVIKNIAESFEVQCNSKNITFELTFQEDIPEVFAEQSKIEQVLYNLIDNAIKFSNDNSKIFISVYSKHDSVFISVKDTGIGISKKDIGKIFDRFYKSDTSRGKDKKGTGLGLAIAKEIIQAHGENIDVISTEGAGTEFIFSLSKAIES
jgi:sensory box histidine kinase